MIEYAVIRFTLFKRAYPLTLIKCRKGSWWHVGSNPIARTLYKDMTTN